MNDILFRGKTLNNKRWVFGDLLRDWDSEEKEVLTGIYDFLQPRMKRFQDVIPETLGQFTGFYDKNDNAIFEGDIIRSDDVIINREIKVAGGKYIVTRHKGCWVAAQSKKSWRILAYVVEEGVEVIGNIFDNPELLKENKHE